MSLEAVLSSKTLSQKTFSLFQFFFFLRFIYLFIYFVYSVLSACVPTGQKRAPDLITDGYESPCGCWELNSGPLGEQSVLLTSEPLSSPFVSILAEK